MRRLLLVAIIVIAAAPSGRAADPVPYQVQIASTGEAPLDQAVHDSSTLNSLHDTAPVGPFALVARARTDQSRFVTAMQSYGHYDGTATITINGRSLDDPALADELTAAPATPPAKVAVALAPGPVFKLRTITLTGDVPPGSAAKLGLAEGSPAVAADVVEARNRLETALLKSGRALAHVDAPVATLDEATKSIDVSYKVAAGPVVSLGAISFAGLDQVNESYARRRLRLASGEQYDPDRIERARQDMIGAGVFSSVRIANPDSPPQLDRAGHLPVAVTVVERPRRAVDVSAAFSTDQGGSVATSWTHRNLFGNAEQLTLSAAATELGGSASRQPGYDVLARLTLPDWQRRAQSLTFTTEAIKQSLEAYDRTAYLASAVLGRRLSRELSVSAGLAGEQAHFFQQEVGRDYTLLQVPLTVTWDSGRPLFDPVTGFRATGTMTPSESLANSNHTRTASFVITQASGSTYFDVGEMVGSAAGSSVVATRALVGAVAGASVLDLPPDQRFYGGGSGTIRGFRFESVGPLFPDKRPIGGNAIDAASLELRQHFGKSWGAAVFVDGGQVASNGVPFTGKFEVGAGTGVRYYTPIGPIRVDIAVPLTHVAKTDAVQLYIGLGQAF